MVFSLILPLAPLCHLISFLETIIIKDINFKSRLLNAIINDEYWRGKGVSSALP